MTVNAWGKVLAYGVVAPVVIGLNCLVDGYVMMKLWAWFIVPAFHVPEITMTLGLGLSLIVGHLTHQSQLSPKDTELEDHLINLASTLFFRPGIILVVGWLVKTWFLVGVVR